MLKTPHSTAEISTRQQFRQCSCEAKLQCRTGRSASTSGRIRPSPQPPHDLTSPSPRYEILGTPTSTINIIKRQKLRNTNDANMQTNIPQRTSPVSNHNHQRYRKSAQSIKCSRRELKRNKVITIMHRQHTTANN